MIDIDVSCAYSNAQPGGALAPHHSLGRGIIVARVVPLSPIQARTASRPTLAEAAPERLGARTRLMHQVMRPVCIPAVTQSAPPLPWSATEPTRLGGTRDTGSGV